MRLKNDYAKANNVENLGNEVVCIYLYGCGIHVERVHLLIYVNEKIKTSMCKKKTSEELN